MSRVYFLNPTTGNYVLGNPSSPLDMRDAATGAAASQSVLLSSAVAVPHTGDTLEVTFATLTIPANSMGINGVLRISPIWTFTGSTNSKTLKVKLGGTTFSSQAVSTGTAVVISVPTQIANRGATNSQIATFQTAAGSAAPTTGAIDTTADAILLVTGQLANSGETLTLESLIVELLRS